ncbi:MAG: prepilin-type N-terminal cleavage/methylation domain-containing protein [Butyrivibrio sp.]|nr:prepilin-type N-terminal cleavage/methylation domain-containing protein [Butyrivibrio sp.]
MFVIGKHRKRNKGFSLLEVLVAVAITAIIATLLAAFISSGSRSFKKQSNSIDLQNMLQETSNKITDSLMEATSVTIKEQEDALWIYTGDFDKSDPKVRPKLILWVRSAGEIYIMDYKINSVSEAAEGYCMAKYVKDFKIELDSRCQNSESHKWEQPLMFNVSVSLENQDEAISDSKTTTLRNKIDLLEIYGVKYDLK